MLAAVAAEQYTEEVEIIRIISGRVIFAHINNNIVFYICNKLRLEVRASCYCSACDLITSKYNI